MMEPNGPPQADIIQKQADEVVDKFPDVRT